jgi:putative radical SAM enzyme (TIGR03279 family)
MTTSPHPASFKAAGIRIRTIPKTSVFFEAGIRKGDTILSVNNEKVSDELDFRFLAATSLLRIVFARGNRLLSAEVERKTGTFLDMEFYEQPVRRCANRCIFCFIDQMPKGLRRRLYIKDEDLSHSFLNGNYVTLTNATKPVLDRIVSIGLSPLFVSVHATDASVRNAMLGIKRSPAILDQLRFLKRNGIAFHTQIVVCPGYNDGAVLEHTIRDLLSLGRNILSVAVVPVGLTRFRSFPLEPVRPSNAAAIVNAVSRMSDRDAKRSGRRRLFLADELFLIANLPLPARPYYEEYPQIENGVGLLRQLLESWRTAKRTKRLNPKHSPAQHGKKYLLLSSYSAYPFLRKIAQDAGSLLNAELVVEPVINRFFGETVTVAGLLTARDVIRSIRRATSGNKYHAVLLPAAMFNYADFTLDGYSRQRIAKLTGISVITVRTVDKLLSL